MFILKKTLTPFLLPPGIFVICFISSGVWLLFKGHRRIGSFNLTLGCLMWVLSISPVSQVMLNGLESCFSVPVNLQGDVIILLNGGGEDMPLRIISAVRLQKKLNVPLIISGGDAHVLQVIAALDVPVSEIITEFKSRDTFENAKYTRGICVRAGYKKPILVTSPYHLKRAVFCFTKVGIDVIPFPAEIKSLQDTGGYKWHDFLSGSFRNASIAIKEYLGLVFYKFVY